MSRTWANGPAGGTPLSATRLNDLETDIQNALDGRVTDATVAQQMTTGAQTKAAVALLSVPVAKVGVAGGVAALDGSGQISAGQLPAASAGSSQAGTYAARPAANTVTTGTTYYATDVQESYRASGGAWTVVGAGGNNLANTISTTGGTTTSLAYVDIAGMTATFVAGERPIDIRADIDLAHSSAGATVSIAIVLDGVQVSEINAPMVGSNKWGSWSRTVPKSGLVPGSTHTVKLQIKADTAGTARYDGNPGKPAVLSVQGR